MGAQFLLEKIKCVIWTDIRYYKMALRRLLPLQGPLLFNSSSFSLSLLPFHDNISLEVCSYVAPKRVAKTKKKFRFQSRTTHLSECTWSFFVEYSVTVYFNWQCLPDLPKKSYLFADFVPGLEVRKQFIVHEGNMEAWQQRCRVRRRHRT